MIRKVLESKVLYFHSPTPLPPQECKEHQAFVSPHSNLFLISMCHVSVFCSITNLPMMRAVLHPQRTSISLTKLKYSCCEFQLISSMNHLHQIHGFEFTDKDGLGIFVLGVPKQVLQCKSTRTAFTRSMMLSCQHTLKQTKQVLLCIFVNK